MDKLVIGRWDLERTNKNHRFIYCPGTELVQYLSGMKGIRLKKLEFELEIEPLFDLKQKRYIDIDWWFI